MKTDIFSQLRLLEADQLYSYESVGLLENRLSVDLDEINLLRHPFPVTPLNGEDYLLLEESEYFHALTEAGLAHVPVQICPPESLTPQSCLLGLTDFHKSDLEHAAARHSDQIEIIPANSPDARGAGIHDAASGDTPIVATPSARALPLTFSFPDQPPLFVRLRHSSRIGCPASLDTLFRAILSRGRYQPTVKGDDNTDSITKLTTFSGMVNIPAFSLDDLKTAATAERLFPPGVARVESTLRALNIDFPLSVLTSPIPIEEKQQFMRELIRLRHRARRTSSYSGRIYLLNR